MVAAEAHILYIAHNMYPKLLTQTLTFINIKTNNLTANAGNGSTQSPLDLDAIRRLYGSGLAMQLATERQMALKVGGRLPGLDANPDSRAMYETLTGDDISLSFGDYMNLKKNRAGGNGFGGAADEVPHNAVESKLGL